MPHSRDQETPPDTELGILPEHTIALDASCFDDRDDRAGCAVIADSHDLAAHYLMAALQRLQALEDQRELSADAQTDLCTVRTLLAAALQNL